jgi:hypothetical protein
MVFPVAADDVTTINFDDLKDWDVVANQYATQGVTFSGDVQILSKYGSLNYGGYPPHSDNNVIFSNNEGKITATFASPVSSVDFYYSSATSLYIDAYDKQNIKIETASGPSITGANGHITLNVPNIDHVVIHDNGNFFVVDDFSFSSSTSIPEFPSIAVPVMGILGVLFVIGRKKN